MCARRCSVSRPEYQEGGRDQQRDEHLALAPHANAAETALMLHLRPELVVTGEIHDDPDRTDGLVFGYTVAETSRDGLTGAPSRGTAEGGARLYDAAVAALAEVVERARREQPPSLD